MVKELNGVNLTKMGVAYAAELEKVECDPKLKYAIYEIANNLHETNKRLNYAIATIIDLNNALQAIGLLQDRMADKMYKKANQHE